MLAPISWLKDFVDIDITAEELSDRLVAIGFEVEEIIYQNRQATNVFVCKILSVEKHPKADKLSVCQVEVSGKKYQIVTNCKMEVGEYVPVALDSAVLYDGTVIKKGELRGVESDGMFCGISELGLTSDDVEGASADDVLRLKGKFKTGENVFDAVGYNDVILDVSVTANRPDCNSIYKLAKEVAVATKKTCRAPETEYKTSGEKYDFSVEVKNEELCPRYMTAGVKNVKIFPSDKKIKQRLRAVGIRPINNIVDITNYVLTEIGQPMHAFDRRYVEGGKIIVREANDGEKITTLDGKENNLTKDILVICDAVKPVAIAGIMGGEYSGIMPDTSEIVFESAKFKRDMIRREARFLNLHSDSQARYEKGVDFSSQELGLKRALNLIWKSGSGDILEGIIDKKVKFEPFKKLTVKTQKLSDILGIEVDAAKAAEIFNTLGLESVVKGDSIECKIPEDRDDIVGANDLAEEYIRVLGYGNIKPTLFQYSQLIKGEVMPHLAFADKVKNALSNLGLYEIVTYSFTSPKCFDMLRLSEKDYRRKCIKIKNPLGEAVSIMRTTLLHSILEIVASNESKSQKNLALFEVAKVYIPKKLPLTELPDEVNTLAVALSGEAEDFFTLKNVVEKLGKAVGVDFTFKKKVAPYLHDGQSAEVFVGDVSVGLMGQIHPLVAEEYAVSKTFVCEINLDVLEKCSSSVIRVKDITKFPTVERDLAVVVDDIVIAGDMLDAIKGEGIPNLEKAEIFDVFKGAQVGENKKSIAFNFEFVSYEKTLVDAEVNDAMDRVLKLLETKFGAKIR